MLTHTGVKPALSRDASSLQRGLTGLVTDTAVVQTAASVAPACSSCLSTHFIPDSTSTRMQRESINRMFEIRFQSHLSFREVVKDETLALFFFFHEGTSKIGNRDLIVFFLLLGAFLKL